MRSAGVGRGREDDVEPSDSRRSAQPDAKFVIAECTSFFDVLTILLFTVLFAFCSSELYGDIQCSGTLSKVEKTVNKRLHGLQLCRSKAVGRGREDDVEPSDSRRSAQPDAKFVMSQKH